MADIVLSLQDSRPLYLTLGDEPALGIEGGLSWPLSAIQSVRVETQ